jgi:hypothetical protein
MGPCGLDLPVDAADIALREDVSSDCGDASVSSTRSLSPPEHSLSLPPKSPLSADTLYYNKSDDSPPIVVRSYICPHAECAARLRSEAALTKHFKTKHPPKSYFCGRDGCTQSFPDVRSQRRHWTTLKHRTINDPVYTCHCSASQPRWDKFKLHLQSCTADRVASSMYSCCCSRTFQSKPELEKHNLAHANKPGRPRKRREIPGKESL